MPFQTFADVRTLLGRLPEADAAAVAAAEARNTQLTKPPGALGRLERLAVWMAGWQGTEKPHADAPQIVIFAGNHGVAAQGVSAFPPEVTVQINQLSRTFGAKLDVHALDLDRPTHDFTTGPAMTEAETVAALRTGYAAVDPKADLFVAGEMGIGNTTVAAALAAALFGGSGWAGRGTGVDNAGLARKEAAIAKGLSRHQAVLADPLQVLACLGGREIAAMAGAILGARMHRIPVVLDGFIVCSAAAVLAKTTLGALDHCVAGHVSAEGAHGRLLAELGKEPLLSLGLRLGEGSGAALAIGVIKGAVACHSGMATFAEAGVAGG
jgi:nicotinate-nucleotide--dimethylbenzimidazole phosphoribosyltransferase